MNLRSVWAGAVGNKPVSDALTYITKRINLIWLREHTGEGAHTIIHERGRSVALGVPIDVAYTPTNYAGSTTGTAADWTVPAANATTFRYSLAGDLMTVGVRVTGSNVANAPAQLWVRMPDGYVSTARVGSLCFVSNAGVATTGRVLVEAFTSGPVIGTVIVIVLLAGGVFTNTGANNTQVELELAVWVRKQ